jgi:uncharacterized protein YqkB
MSLPKSAGESASGALPREVDPHLLVEKPPKARVHDSYFKARTEEGYQTNRFKRFVASGKSTVLGFYTALTPDCSVSGIVTIRVVKQPEHGSIEIVETTGFPVAHTGVYAKCNQQKVEGVQVAYKSTEKFIGSDTIEILALLPGGFAWKNYFDIAVR